MFSTETLTSCFETMWQYWFQSNLETIQYLGANSAVHSVETSLGGLTVTHQKPSRHLYLRHPDSGQELKVPVSPAALSALNMNLSKEQLERLMQQYMKDFPDRPIFCAKAPSLMTYNGAMRKQEGFWLWLTHRYSWGWHVGEFDTHSHSHIHSSQPGPMSPEQVECALNDLASFNRYFSRDVYIERGSTEVILPPEHIQPFVENYRKIHLQWQNESTRLAKISVDSFVRTILWSLMFAIIEHIVAPLLKRYSFLGEKQYKIFCAIAMIFRIIISIIQIPATASSYVSRGIVFVLNWLRPECIFAKTESDIGLRHDIPMVVPMILNLLYALWDDNAETVGAEAANYFSEMGVSCAVLTLQLAVVCGRLIYERVGPFIPGYKPKQD